MKHNLCVQTRARRRGIIIVWIAILGIALVGLVGLALDTGYVFLTAHQLQNAADSSALAGAAKVKFNLAQATADSVATAAANKAAKASVQLDAAAGDVQLGHYDRATAVFSVNTTPYNAVRVKARRTTGSPGGPVGLFFAPAFGTVFGTDLSTADVARGATAMTGGFFWAGMVVLDPTRKSSIGLSGNPELRISGGGIQVNSDSSSAVTIKGTSDMTATELRVTGGVSSNGNADLPSTVYTGATPVEDPLKGLPVPGKGPDLGTVNAGSNQVINLQPGYYSGGITNHASNSTINLAPGTYVLGPPGLDINGGNLSAPGVTLFFTTGNSGNQYGTVQLNGNGSINISAPTSGTYKGITFYQDPATPYNSATAWINGTANLNLQGTVYLPSIGLTLSGNSDNLANQIIVDTVDVSGNGILRVNYDGRNPVEINNVFLVE